MAWQNARVIWTRSSRGNQIVRQSKGSMVSLKDFERSESEDRVSRSHFFRMANIISYGRSGNGFMVMEFIHYTPLKTIRSKALNAGKYAGNTAEITSQCKLVEVGSRSRSQES